MMASNQRANIDAAFIRHLKSIIHFPMPRPEERYVIWKKPLLSQTAVADDMVIQQILRRANVTTTMNIYVKTVSVDAANAMKYLETMRATTAQSERIGSTRKALLAGSQQVSTLDAVRGNWRRGGDSGQPAPRNWRLGIARSHTSLAHFPPVLYFERLVFVLPR